MPIVFDAYHANAKFREILTCFQQWQHSLASVSLWILKKDKRILPTKDPFARETQISKQYQF